MFKDWSCYYKINPEENTLIESNLIYTPYISPDKKKFCMSFDHTSKYQTEELKSWLPERPYYTKEMVKFFFDREIKYLTVFAKYSWAPRILDIDPTNQLICFEWPGETCNNIIYTGRKLEDYCPNWKDQLFTIIKDIVDAGYYKTSLYPHCFYIDNGILHTFDFYGCVEADNPFVKIDDIRGMIGVSSGARFDAAADDKYLNVEVLFKEALQRYIKWPDDFLEEVYCRLFQNGKK